MGFDLFSPQRQGEVDPGGSVREVFDKLFLRTWHSRAETRVLRIFDIFSKVTGMRGFKDAARIVTKSLLEALEIHTLNAYSLPVVIFFI